jgi:hypothetical protein
VIVWLLSGRNARALQPPRAYGEAAAGGRGLCSCPAAPQGVPSVLAGPCRCTPPSALALAWPDDKLRRACRLKHPRWLQSVVVAGHSSRPSRGSPQGRGSGQPRPCQDRGHGRRDPAEDGKIDSERLEVEAAEPVRSAGDSRYIFTVNPAGPTSGICYPIRTAAPLVLRRQQDRCRRTCPNGRITTALVDPDGPGLVTEAIPGPTLHAWVGSADQHPVGWCQSCGPRATDQAGEVIGCVGSAVLQRLERAHNFADREPITLAPTVEPDLGKRGSAQRFLVVPW